METHLLASESELDSDVDWDCPLCMEEMDLSDQNFRPCPCGYQVCRFCWHRIRENGSSSCPACRRVYTEDSVEFTPISADVLAKAKEKKRVKEKKREAAFKEIATSHHGSSHPAATKVVDIISSRRSIADYRVIQRNLVYVIGVSPKIASESILRSHEFFGQYGSIIKIVVNKRNISTAPTGTGGKSEGRSEGERMASASAYVTYQRAEDAAKAIAGIDGSIYDSRVIRATYGTTKYCSFYLRGLPCPNSGCMYLHEQGELADSYTKEQLSVGNHHLHSGSASKEPEKKVFGDTERSKVVDAPKPGAPVIPENRLVVEHQPARTAVSPPPMSSINVPPISVDIDDFFARLTRTMNSGSSSNPASNPLDLLSKTRDTIRSNSPAPVGHSRPPSTVSSPREGVSSFVGGSSVLGGVIWNRHPGSRLSRSPSPPTSENAFSESKSIDQFFSLFKTLATEKSPSASAATTATTSQASSSAPQHAPGIPSPKITIAKREPVTIKTPDNRHVQLGSPHVSAPREGQFTPHNYHNVKEVPLVIPPSPSKVILKKAPLDVKAEPRITAKASNEFISGKASPAIPVQILQRQESTPPPTSKQQPAIGTQNLFSLLQTDASSSDDSSDEDSDTNSKTALHTNSTTNSSNTSSAPNTQPAPTHKKTPSISPVTASGPATLQQSAKGPGKKGDADMAAEIKRLESALSANMAEVSQLELQLKQLLLSQQNKK